MSELLDTLARDLVRSMPRRRALRLLGGVLLAATPLGAAATARAKAGTCTPFDLERTRNECETLTRETGRTYVLCLPPGGSNDRCWSACCRSGDYCCITPVGSITCCSPFFGGVCSKDPRTRDACRGACRPGEVKCGSRCCAKGQGCRNGKCCKKCGEKKCCIAGETCCGDRCCKKDETCCTSAGRKMCCPPGEKCAVPILPGDIAIRPRTPPICCPELRRHESPRLCCPPGQVALRGPGQRVGPGLSPYCCPRARFCAGKCCQTGLTGTETCCDGRCIDLKFNQQNCGRCGRQCIGTQRCVNGACVS